MRYGLLITSVFLLWSVQQGKTQFYTYGTCSTPVGEVLLKQKDSLGDRGLGDNYHLWDNGSIVRVKFMPGGSTIVRERVIRAAKEWELFANIRFQFLPDTATATDVRIRLARGYGHNSALGTQALFRKPNEQTVNFDTLFFADQEYYVKRLQQKNLKPPYSLNQLIQEMREDPNHWNDVELRRVVLHEFGHVMGLLHEQSFPGMVKWKKTDSVYNHYRQTQGWTRDKVDFNVFEVSNQFYTNGTKYDPQSIMHYSINAWETEDGYAVPVNNDLSAGDKSLIAALYPKGKAIRNREVPRVTVNQFRRIVVQPDTLRKGLVITPSFDMKTNSRVGEVFLVARLATDDGRFIPTDNLFYNWGGVTAAYTKVNVFPNMRVSYNKPGMPKNVELFIPFSQIPDTKGRRVMVAFAVFLDDVQNSQMNKLMYFSTTQAMSLPTR